MNIFEKPFRILLASADSACGEAVGDAIEALYARGACNVQVVNTITKKNRPGYVFLIEMKKEAIDAAEEYLVKHLGITGWHVLQSTHRYVRVEYLTKVFAVEAGGEHFFFEARCKYCEEAPERYRPEMDSCRGLAKQLLARSFDVPVAQIRRALSDAFEHDTDTLRF